MTESIPLAEIYNFKIDGRPSDHFSQGESSAVADRRYGSAADTAAATTLTFLVSEETAVRRKSEVKVRIMK
jgi:hypothetical protein